MNQIDRNYVFRSLQGIILKRALKLKNNNKADPISEIIILKNKGGVG